MSQIQRARALRANATPWENKLWYEYLRGCPTRFRRQQPIGPYIADFYCSKAKLIIELDGGGHFNQDQQQYDQNRDAYFRQNGLITIRFLNTDIDKRFYEVCDTIHKTVQQRINAL